MKFYHVDLTDLEFAASIVPCRLQDVRQFKTYIQCTIKPTGATPESLRVTGYHGRRVAALNYVGHRIFMDTLFDRCPNARVVSSMRGHDNKPTVYDGRGSYFAQVPHLNQTNNYMQGDN